MTLERDLHRSNWRRVSVIAAIVISVNGLGLVANYNLPERAVLGSKLYQTEQELQRAIVKQTELTSYNADLNDKITVNEKQIKTLSDLLNRETMANLEAKNTFAKLPTLSEWESVKTRYSKLDSSNKGNEKTLTTLRAAVVAKDKEIVKLKKDLQTKPKERIVYKDKIVYRDKSTPKSKAPKGSTSYVNSSGSGFKSWMEGGNLKIEKSGTILSYAPIIQEWCPSTGNTVYGYSTPSGNLAVVPMGKATMTLFTGGKLTKHNICGNVDTGSKYYRQ